ncbi:kinase-like protein [Mycena filopes]|nr:kinase-like protein [Mycena filopes]
MHRRIQIITSLFETPSRSRSPTRSPLSPMSAPQEVKPQKTSIRQIALERKQSLTYPGASPRTIKLRPSMAEAAAGAQRAAKRSKFTWVRGEPIGRGTHGQVSLALNTANGTMFAVKQIRFAPDANELPGGPSPRTLKKELANMAALSHPNLVQYLGHEESNVVKSFVSQVLDGLIYLHARGIMEPTGACKIEGLGCSETEIRDNSRAPEIVRTQYKSYNRTGGHLESSLYHQTLRHNLPQTVALDPLAEDFIAKCLALDPKDRLSAVQLKQHPFLLLSPDWSFEGLRPTA